MITEELKPMDIGGVFDKTFRLITSNAKSFIKIYAIYFAVIFALTILCSIFIFLAFIPSDIINYILNFPDSFSNIADNSNFIISILISIPVVIVYLVIIIYISIIAFGMITDLYLKSFLGENWNFKESRNYIKKISGKIFRTGLLVFLILLGGFAFCFVGIIPFAILTILAMPILIYESNNKPKPISRSFKLASKNFWGIFGSMILIYLICTGFSMILLIFQLGLTLPMTFLNGEYNTLAIVIMVISGILYVIFYIIYIFFQDAISRAFVVVIYFNQRIRHENFGVEILTQNLISESTAENNNLIEK